MDYCKFCGSDVLVKNGFNAGVQRYKCNECGRNMREGDRRVRYSHAKKMKCIQMVLEGVGIRSIARLEVVSAPLILHWMREASALIQQKLAQARAVSERGNIQILELDELFSYVQKNKTASMSGLLWTESEVRWLILK